MSIRQKTISGLIWVFLQQLLVQGTNVVIQIVLMRLLLPHDFGIIAILLVFIAVGNVLVDGGMSSSLIRTSNPDDGDYSSVFLLNLFNSIFIFILLFLLSPIIARFYDLPMLTPILRVFSLSFVIRAFMTVQAARLTKEMDFRSQLIMQIPATIIGGIVAITLAYMGFGVWSLVMLYLSQSFILTLAYWLFLRWKPKMLIDKEKLKLHFNFGYKLALSSILNTVFQNLYNLVIGKKFPITVLGYYNKAEMFSMLPAQNISAAISKVTYPMLSKLQDDDEKLKETYRKIIQYILIILAPLMLFLLIVGQPLFKLIFTEKWLPSVPYFQILCLPAIISPLHEFNLNILNVKGRSDLFLKLEIVKKILIIVGVSIALQFGILGLLYFQVVFGISAYFINAIYAGRMINYPLSKQVIDIWPIFGLNLFSYLITYSLYLYCLTQLESEVLQIFLSGVIFLAIYLLTAGILKIKPYFELRRLIFKYLKLK